jgi:hypothetical protein
MSHYEVLYSDNMEAIREFAGSFKGRLVVCPLRYAIARGRFHILDLLLEIGVDPQGGEFVLQLINLKLYDRAIKYLCYVQNLSIGRVILTIAIVLEQKALLEGMQQVLPNLANARTIESIRGLVEKNKI